MTESKVYDWNALPFPGRAEVSLDGKVIPKVIRAKEGEDGWIERHKMEQGNFVPVPGSGELERETLHGHVTVNFIKD